MAQATDAVTAGLAVSLRYTWPSVCFDTSKMSARGRNRYLGCSGRGTPTEIQVTFTRVDEASFDKMQHLTRNRFSSFYQRKLINYVLGMWACHIKIQCAIENATLC